MDLFKTLGQELKRWRSLLQQAWLAKGQNRIPVWVFPNQSGKMLDMQNLKNRQYRQVLKKAKLRYIPFHCLRGHLCHAAADVQRAAGLHQRAVGAQGSLGDGGALCSLDVLPGPDAELVTETVKARQFEESKPQ